MSMSEALEQKQARGQKLRRLGAVDAAACADIVMRWIDRTPWMKADDRATVETALREGSPLREAWGLGTPLKGYISLNVAEGHIGGLYVDQPGQGLGKLLLDRVKQGRDRLELNSHLPNKAAHAFYRREGFAQVGEPWPGSDGIDEITMEWQR